MKKILFPLLTLLFMVSCSSDDDNNPIIIPNPEPQSVLKATIDGTEYTFNSVEVETIPNTDYVDLHVVATISGDASKTIIFDLEQMQTGTEAIYYFYHLNGELEYNTDATFAAFSTNVTSNTANNITGTFSGPLSNFDDTETVTVTNGSFNINY